MEPFFKKVPTKIMIRRATVQDIEGINALLRQVLGVHHQGRPDLFRANGKKYTDEELTVLLTDDSRPVFCMVDEENHVLGYAFCVFIQHIGDNILTDIKTLYIDDLCVDENRRGQQIGSTLFEYVKSYAKESGCYNLTLNVWTCNESARRFYEKCGLIPQKIGMEMVL